MNDLLPYLPDQLNRALGSLPYFAPEFYLTVLFIMVLVTDLLFKRGSAKMCRLVAAGGMLLVIFKVLLQYGMVLKGPMFLFGDMLLLQHSSVVFKLIIDVISFLLIIYFPFDDKLASHRKGLSDLYTIIIAAIFGLHLMVMASHLISIYVAIEMVSIASYLLVAYRTESGKGQEAALKYVLFGAAASAIMLYGMSLLYVYTGSMSLFFAHMVGNLMTTNPIAVYFALALVLVGIGFKLSFVPMQFWVPDVYEGAPTPVTAWLSTVPKIAGFGLLANVLYAFIFAKIHVDLRALLSGIGIITMIAGNFAAVMQKNVKRMLAYSSIGHTGFALIMAATLTGTDLTPLTFYLFAYALANLAALMLATYFANNENAENMEDYRGFGFKYPVASVCFVIVLVSLTGLPVTAGFTGKLFIFTSAYNFYQQTHNAWALALMITGAVTTVVSLFYYFRIPLNLFLRKVENQVDSATTGRVLLGIVLIISVFLVLIGVFPSIVTIFL